MTVETLYCAICGQKTAPDSDHVQVEAETIWTDARNDLDEFVFHLECWDRLSDGWADPV